MAFLIKPLTLAEDPGGLTQWMYVSGILERHTRRVLSPSSTYWLLGAVMVFKGSARGEVMSQYNVKM